jgi:hypothetical protein
MGRLLFKKDVHVNLETLSGGRLNVRITASDSRWGISLHSIFTSGLTIPLTFRNVNDGTAGFNFSSTGNLDNQQIGDRLTVALDTTKNDPDGNGRLIHSATYRWYYTDDDNTAVGTGARTASYTINTNDRGKTLGVEIRYIDGGGFTETVHKVMSAEVGSLNAAPTASIDAASGSVIESAHGAAISGIKFTPGDAAGTTYSFEILAAAGETLSSAELQELFEVIALTGADAGSYGLKLKSNQFLDHEVKDTYLLKIVISDGTLEVETAAITINVGNVNDHSPVFADTGEQETFKFAENEDELTFSAATDTGYTITATDADGGKPLLTLSGDDMNRFELGADGTLWIKANSVFTEESLTRWAVELTVTAADTGMGTGDSPGDTPMTVVVKFDPPSTASVQSPGGAGAAVFPDNDNKENDDDDSINGHNHFHPSGCCCSHCLQKDHEPDQYSHSVIMIVHEGETLIFNLDDYGLSNPAIRGDDEDDVQIRQTQEGLVLEFVSPPDYENPADGTGPNVEPEKVRDNIYEFTVYDASTFIDFDIAINDIADL